MAVRICLAVILAHGFTHDSAASVVIDLIYYLAVGVIAQAVALLASLIAVRRRQSHSRLEIFIYQFSGPDRRPLSCLLWDVVHRESGGLHHHP